MKQPRGFALPIVLALVALAALLAAGGYWYVSRNSSQAPAAQVPQRQDVSPSASATQPTGSTMISVPGMSKYTDSDFGFSFWYPSGWNLSRNSSGVYPLITIKEPSGVYPRTIEIAEATPPDGVVNASGACGSCAEVKYYFDRSTHTWMQIYNGAFSDSAAATAADVSNNTMGGLHIFKDGSRFGGSVVPLSAKRFLLISGDDGGKSYNLGLSLTNTVVATDPSVATPVSDAEQQAAIAAEAAAYGIH